MNDAIRQYFLAPADQKTFGLRTPDIGGQASTQDLGKAVADAT